MTARRINVFLLPLLIALLQLPLSPPVSAASPRTPALEYHAYPALIDLRTTFSDGTYNPETLLRMARQKGFAVVCLNDHDRLALEYGLPPFRNWLKYRKELNSINVAGADRYLRIIHSLREIYPDTVLIPGTESAPFYYWTGSPFSGNLTAHDHERRILTMGLEKPEDYETLPVLHNGFSRFTIRESAPALAAFTLCFLLGLYLMFLKGGWRICGVILALLSAGLFVDTLRATPSPFDPYHGRQGAAPYQLFIDAVSRKGGLTFWNYPETRSGIRSLGPIGLKTLPYPEMLLETKNYTGFAALYGDTITITEPGSIWDVVLREHCAGFRESPPWGIATADFHREGESGQKLGDFQTILLMKDKSPRSVLEALKSGRMYACQGDYPRIPRLDEFSVSSSDSPTAHRAISGEELALSGNPRIRIRLSGGRAGENTVQVRLIRNGSILQTFRGTLPLQIDHTDLPPALGEKIYYRMDMTGFGTVVSNPIFVRFKR